MTTTTTHQRLAAPADAADALDARVVIGFAAGLGAVLALATDIYLIVMPSIAREFGASLAATQATMASFAAGFGLAHLFVGVAADRWGRRPVAVFGVVAFLVTTLAVVMAPTLEALTMYRFVQGLMAATCPILSRAIIRDAIPTTNIARAYSASNMLIGVAPLVAPFIGAWANAWGGWRMAIGCLLAYGAVLAVAVIGWLPETSPAKTGAHAGRPAVSPFAAAGQILGNLHFQLGTLAAALIYGSLFTWLTTSPFLLIDAKGYGTTGAALIYGAGAACYILTNLAATRLGRHHAPERMLAWGGVLMLAGSMLALTTLARDGVSLTITVLALMPYYIGLGFAHPNSLQTAMRPFAGIAGQASAWLGLFQQLSGVAVSLIAVRLGGGLAAVWVMIACTAGLLGASVMIDRTRQ